MILSFEQVTNCRASDCNGYKSNWYLQEELSIGSSQRKRKPGEQGVSTPLPPGLLLFRLVTVSAVALKETLLAHPHQIST